MRPIRPRRAPVPRRLRRSKCTRRRGQLYESTHFVTAKRSTIYNSLYSPCFGPPRKNRGEPAPSQLGSKLIPRPAGITSVLQTSKYSRRGLLAATESKIAQAVRRFPHQELFQSTAYFGNGNRITRLLA